jgi:hypothetical protein
LTSFPLVSSVVSGYAAMDSKSARLAFGNSVPDSHTKIIMLPENTLETSGEDEKTTLETSGEDHKTTLETSEELADRFFEEKILPAISRSWESCLEFFRILKTKISEIDILNADFSFFENELIKVEENEGKKINDVKLQSSLREETRENLHSKRVEKM